MAEEKKKEKQQLELELPADVAKGVYSNLAMITHSDAEFIIDFLQLLPGLPKAMVRSRIILTPSHAKRLLSALSDNVAKYEKRNGPIGVASEEGGAMPFMGGAIPPTEA